MYAGLLVELVFTIHYTEYRSNITHDVSQLLTKTESGRYRTRRALYVRCLQEQLARTASVEAGQDTWPPGPHVLVFAEA
jgi:hypothetical protein